MSINSHNDYINFVYAGIDIPRESSCIIYNPQSVTPTRGTHDITSYDLPAHASFRDDINSHYSGILHLTNYKSLAPYIDHSVYNFRSNLNASDVQVDNYIQGASVDMNAFLARANLQTMYSTLSNTLTSEQIAVAIQMKTIESNALPWNGENILLCRRFNLPPQTPSTLIMNPNSSFSLKCFESIEPGDVMYNLGWTSCLYGIENPDSLTLHPYGMLKPIRKGTEYPPLGFQGRNVYLAILMLPGASYMPVQTTEENSAEREIILPSNTMLYVLNSVNYDIGGVTKTFIFTLYAPNATFLKTIQDTLQQITRYIDINHMEVFKNKYGVIGGATKKYIVYDGHRYLVRKDNRKSYIKYKGTITYLKDIKGKYKKC